MIGTSECYVISHSIVLNEFLMFRYVFVRFSEMEGEANHRLPLNDPMRIQQRDYKLWGRDEARATRDGKRAYKCPCNLCGGRRREMHRRTIYRHWKALGRHNSLRGWTEVLFNPIVGHLIWSHYI